MKTFKLSNKSWHYHIVKTYSSLDEWFLNRGVDFCEYLRALIAGILAIILIILGASIVLSILLYPLISIVAQFDIGFHIPDDFTIIILITESIALSVFGVVLYAHDKSRNIYKRKRQKVVECDPGFYTLAYRKFKEKTCFKVEIV